MSGAVAASAANVSQEDKVRFIDQDVNDFVSSCEKNIGEHKFECANAGLTIGHTIISEFLQARVKATQPGQMTSASNEDIFTMLNVLAK